MNLNPAVESLAAQIRPLFASDPTAPQFTVMLQALGLHAIVDAEDGESPHRELPDLG